MQQGLHHRLGAAVPRAAGGREVLVGQIHVVAVEGALAILSQSGPDVRARFHLHDVGGLAEVAGLDYTNLKNKYRGHLSVFTCNQAESRQQTRATCRVLKDIGQH